MRCAIRKVNTEYKGQSDSKGVKVGFTEKMHMILREQQGGGVIREHGTLGVLEVSPCDGSKDKRYAY